MGHPMSGKEVSENRTLLFRGQIFLWLTLLLSTAVTLFVRVRLLDIPFERDEGEYAYTARLILSRVPPYAEAYDLKMPGLHGIYALFLSLLGDNVRGVHSGLLVVSALSVFCIFLIGKSLYGRSGAIISAATFSLLALSQRVYGFSANAESLLLLPLLCGLIILLRPLGREKKGLLFLSGFLFGLAFIVKQTAIFFVLFAIVFILWSDYRGKDRFGVTAFNKALLFIAGVLVPLFAVSATLFYLGTFRTFWYWTFQYAYLYSAETPLYLGMKSLYSALGWIIPPVIVFWAVAGFYLLVKIFGKRGDGNTFLELSFFLFSVLSVSAGLYFREHYFILLIPALSLLFGGGTLYLSQLIKKRIRVVKTETVAMAILCFAMFYMLYSEREYLFRYTPEEVSQVTYNVNPFVESIEISEYIKMNSGPNERVAILGSEPQIFFYSRRLSATKHIVMYPLMNPRATAMQLELISEIESAAPRILLFIKSPGSWGLKEESEKLIFNWASQYILKHYVKSGVVDINPPEPSKFYWDEEVLDMKKDITYGAYLFKRKEPASTF